MVGGSLQGWAGVRPGWGKAAQGWGSAQGWQRGVGSSQGSGAGSWQGWGGGAQGWAKAVQEGVSSQGWARIARGWAGATRGEASWQAWGWGVTAQGSAVTVTAHAGDQPEELVWEVGNSRGLVVRAQDWGVILLEGVEHLQG